MRGPKIVRAAAVRLQTPVNYKAKYISETLMRRAFTHASVPIGDHKVVPMVLKLLKSNVGLRAMPGWFVDRANKRKRKR